MIWQRGRALLRTLLRRKQVERELDDELQHYLDSVESGLVAKGVDPKEARRRAAIAPQPSAPVPKPP